MAERLGNDQFPLCCKMKYLLNYNIKLTFRKGKTGFRKNIAAFSVFTENQKKRETGIVPESEEAPAAIQTAAGASSFGEGIVSDRIMYSVFIFL
ncbi:UNVERIFIED_ORG: hypothetical protein B5F06_02140 [Lacrimispora saccharolytica]